MIMSHPQHSLGFQLLLHQFTMRELLVMLAILLIIGVAIKPLVMLATLSIILMGSYKTV